MTVARNVPIVICSFFLASFFSLQAVPIRFLPWDDSVAARKIAFHNGKDVTEIQDLHPDKRSKACEWTAAETPPELIALDRTGADGKPVTIPLALTAGIKSPLVLILPDPAKPGGLRGYVVEDSSGSFAWGSSRFINATGRELLVRQDKLVKKLPKSWQATDFAPGGAARNVGIQIAAPDDLNSVLYSAVWEYEPNIRKLVIVIPGADPKSGTVDLKIIPEDRRSLGTPDATKAP